MRAGCPNKKVTWTIRASGLEQQAGSPWPVHQLCPTYQHPLPVSWTGAADGDRRVGVSLWVSCGRSRLNISLFLSLSPLHATVTSSFDMWGPQAHPSSALTVQPLIQRGVGGQICCCLDSLIQCDISFLIYRKVCFLLALRYIKLGCSPDFPRLNQWNHVCGSKCYKKANLSGEETISL